MTESKAKTGVEFIAMMAETKESTVDDSIIMQNILRGIGFPKAVCTNGIVYLKGYGTIKSPPISIQTVAKQLLSVLNHKAQADYEPTEEMCGF